MASILISQNQKYFHHELELCSIFWSFQQDRTKLFLGQNIKNQENDVFLLLPRDRKFIAIEVKSYRGKVQQQTLKPLEEGEKFFHMLMKYLKDNLEQPMKENNDGWEYIKVVALPNQPVRPRNMANDKYILITAAEMNQNFIDVLKCETHWKKTHSNDQQSFDNLTYKALVQILFASAHCQRVSKSPGNIGLRPVDFNFTVQRKTCQAVEPENVSQRAQRNLLGQDTPSVSAGFSHDQPDLPGTSTKFSKLKGLPVAHIASFIFWNPQQYGVLQQEHQRQIEYQNQHQGLIILGEYGTGKTMLLMSLVQQSLKHCHVVFICDKTCSSRIFDERIKIFCNEISVDFFSINFGTEINDFHSIVKTTKRPCHFFVDELDFRHIHVLTSEFSKEFIQRITCAINPEREADIKAIPVDWRCVQLAKVMRNTGNLYEAASERDISSDPVIDVDILDTDSDQTEEDTFNNQVTTSTVLGPRPKLVLINPGDWCSGLALALCLLKEEEKVVILWEDDLQPPNFKQSYVPFKTIVTALHLLRPEIDIYNCDDEADRALFFRPGKGFLVCRRKDFRNKDMCFCLKHFQEYIRKC